MAFGFVLLSFTAAAQERLTLAGIDTAFWKPAGANNTYAEMARPPIAIFSHGYGGCATQSTFLMEALAKDGYAVFAPNHDDAQCDHPGRSPHPTEKMAPLEKPEAWTAETYRNRGADIAALVAAIEADPVYRRDYDVAHIALIGHSLGGMTMLAVAGGWEDWTIHDPAIKAVLALAPYSAPLVLNGTLGKIAVPVMYQAGTRDPLMTPAIDKKDGAYDKAGMPKYAVEFDGAGHFAWTDQRAEDHDGIVDYALAFLDRYVKDQPTDARLTAEGQGVAVLRFATAEGSKDDEPRAVEPKATPQSPMASPNGTSTQGTLRGRIDNRAQPGLAGSGFFQRGF